MKGIYIHIPFCISKCKYCDFTSYKITENSKKKFISSLKKEIEMCLVEKKEKINTIFIGGGTPSILNKEELKEIIDSLHEKFVFEKDFEFTIECNPGTLNEEKLKMMKSLGVNRLSIGLQSTNNEHLKYIGRIHTYEEFLESYFMARKCGFENINIDLMYALPNQMFDDWKKSLEKVVNLKPEHISAYSLIIEKGTPLYTMYENDEFDYISDEDYIKFYRFTISYLEKNGYKQYEISNYALPNKQCKHNILYWTECLYYAFGVSASGFDGIKRYKNVSSIDDYKKMIDEGKKPVEYTEVISRKDKINEMIMLSLRMNKGLNLENLELLMKKDELNGFKLELKQLTEEKAIEFIDQNICLTQYGREISNSIFIRLMLD